MRPSACCCATTIRLDRRSTEAFSDRRTLEIGGERIELAWHGPNHTPDNIFIHFPDHDALMLVDIVNAGWVPVYVVNLSEDIRWLRGRTGHRADIPVEAR